MYNDRLQKDRPVIYLFGYFSFFPTKEEPTTKQHKETNFKPSGVP